MSCPRRRFGRTELMMPVLTCGGMRLQQTWSPPPGFAMSDVHPDCQRGLQEIIAKCMSLGVNHFETARGYGSSELQYGVALKKHMDAGMFKREDFILQTKVPPKPTAESFREAMETSFRTLDLDGNGLGHVDLFAFHGINAPKNLSWVLKHCLPIVREYQRQGLIRFVGFSTHGMEPLITKAIQTGEFDYVNLHYHFIGSYTASGSGVLGSNLRAVRAARAQDMGLFIISPTDKGGKLYKAPRRFADACAPLSAIEFNNLWLLSRRDSPEGDPLVHTLVVGAARPADFDEHMKSIARLKESEESAAALAEEAASRLCSMYERACGPAWVQGWWKGLPDTYGNVDGDGELSDLTRNPEAVHYTVIAWLWSISHAWGLLEYARERYGSLVSNGKKLTTALKSGKTAEEWVTQSMNGFGPGCDTRGLSAETLAAPLASAACKDQVMAALEWANKNLHPDMPMSQAEAYATLPDMRPDTCWPDRPKPKASFDWAPYFAGKLYLLVNNAIVEDDGEAFATLCSSVEEPMLSLENVKAKGVGVFRAAWRKWVEAKNIDLICTVKAATLRSERLATANGIFSHANEELRSQPRTGKLAATFRLEKGDWKIALLTLSYA